MTVPCEKCKAVSFASSVMKTVAACCSRFPVKLIWCIAFRSSSAFGSNLLLSSYNSFWNNYSPANNQLCNHLHDLLQFFEYYHMLLNQLLLVDWKSLSINHNIIFYFYSWKIISFVMIKQKSLFTPGKLAPIK